VTTEQAALGTIGAGVVGTVDSQGVVTVGSTSLRIWIGGVDRWRRSDVDAGVRQRSIDDTPVMTHSLHGPGGDTTWSAYGFVPMGSTAAAIAVHLSNESTEPVVLASVVGPGRRFELRGDLLVVDGMAVLRCARRPRSWVAHTDLDELARVVESAVAPDEPLTLDMPGFVALTQPLPHTLSTQLVMLGDDRRVEVEASASSSFPVPPTPEQVVSGWRMQLERGTRLLPADPADAAHWDADRCQVALAESVSSPIELAAITAAAAILGWSTEAIQRSTQLIQFIDRRGSIDGSVDATIDALRAWGLLATSGASVALIDEMVPHVASTAGWLIGGRKRPQLTDDQARRGVAALIAASAMMRAAGQDDAARQIAAGAPRLAAATSVGRAAPAETDAVSPVVRAAHRIADLMDRHVTCTVDGIEIAQGFDVSWAGRSVECHDVPTPHGHIGWAMRWHGRRPALLWDVEPSSISVRLAANSVDPSWSTIEITGETLLEVPPGVAEAELLIEATLDALRTGESIVPAGPAEGESFG